MAALSFLIVFLPALAMAQTYSVGNDCPPPADYEAGLDADGWAVAPADIDPPATSYAPEGSVGLDLNLPLNNYTENQVLEDTAPYAELNAGEFDVPLRRNDPTRAHCD